MRNGTTSPCDRPLSIPVRVNLPIVAFVFSLTIFLFVFATCRVNRPGIPIVETIEAIRKTSRTLSTFVSKAPTAAASPDMKEKREKIFVLFSLEVRSASITLCTG